MDIMEGMGSTNQFLMCPDWMLGPDVTANKVVQLYAPLFLSELYVSTIRSLGGVCCGTSFAVALHSKDLLKVAYFQLFWY